MSSGCNMSWFTDLAGKAEDFLNKVDQGAATALSKHQAGTHPLSSSCREESSLINEYSSAAYKTEPTGTHHTSHTASLEASSFIPAAAGNIKRASASATMLAGTANVPATPPISGTGAPNSAKTSAGFVRPRKSEQDVDDDMLFNFLNSSDPPAGSRRDSRREHGKLATSTTEAPTPTPPPPTTPLTIPSAPSTPPSTRGVSRVSSMSSLSVHSVRTSEENSAKDPSQGLSTPYSFNVLRSVCILEVCG